MPEQVIECPKCGFEIPLTDALVRPIEENLRKEYEARSEKLIKKAVAEKLKEEKVKIEKQIEKKVKEESSLEIKDLREQLDEKTKKLQEAEREELKLRKAKRELKERQEKLELEIARKLDEEREKIKDKITKNLGKEHQLKIAEKDKQIKEMQKQIEELSRKAEQTSQQLIGEVLELQIEEILRTNFASDKIEPIPKGRKGADVFQRIYTTHGRYCGTIVWESKRTKRWSDKWIPKLKEDQRRSKAEIGVIVSTTLPPTVSTFDYVNGVWVTDYQFVIPLATMLRNQLIEIAGIKQSIEGKAEKKEILYRYLTSPEFKQKIEMTVEAFIDLKKGLDGEKRAMERLWKKREKEILRAVLGIAGMYGDMQGIIGASLPEIKGLEIAALPAATTTGKEKDTDEDV